MKIDPEPLHDGIAAALWPGEWALIADVKSGSARVKRLRLRERAREMLDACRSKRDDRPSVAVPKPANVHMVMPEHALSLLALIQESDRELEITTRDYGKIREVIDLATDRAPLAEADGSPFMRPVFGIIVVDGTVEGACGLFPTQPWDSWETYLRGFFFFVSNAARQKNHGKNLLQWSNWFSDRARMTLVWEVFNCSLLDDRSRMFMRHGSPLGALFIRRPVA